MIISFQNGIQNLVGYTKYEFENTAIWLSGLCFVRGLHAGCESVEYLNRHLNRNAEIPFDKLYGNYSIIVRYPDGKIIVFTDNSSMHGLFMSDTAIASNLMELARFCGIRELNQTAIYEYLTYNRSFSEDTIVKGIRLTSFKNYYCIYKGKLEIKDKMIGDIDAPSNVESVNAFFRDIAFAIENEKHICALTGGFDSRMVSALIHKFDNSDCVISGDNEKSEEIICAKKAANAGNIQLKQIFDEKRNVDDRTIEELYKKQYGYRCRISSAGLRIQYFKDSLSKMGYTILLTGDAGDMHKEFWLTQDFPFYWKNKTNWKKFKNSRMRIIDCRQYITERLRVAGSEVEDKIDGKLISMIKNKNAKSYMFFGWYCDWIRPSGTNSDYSAVISYAPLQEIDVVRYSYHMLPHGKFMNGFIRAVTTEANPSMARAKTIYGTTSSSEPIFLIRDFFMQLCQYGKQFTRMLFRKIFHKSVFVQNVNSIDYDTAIRELATTQNAFEWAKDYRIVKEDIHLSEVNYGFLEKILNIYFCEREITQKTV